MIDFILAKYPRTTSTMFTDRCKNRTHVAQIVNTQLVACSDWLAAAPKIEVCRSRKTSSAQLRLCQITCKMSFACQCQLLQVSGKNCHRCVPRGKTLYTVSQKSSLSVTLSNLNRFSKFLHCCKSLWNLLQNSYNVIHVTLHMLLPEHVSGAGSERKSERSGPKIEWAGAERWAGMSRNGNGAVSGLNWPLKFRSKVIYYCNSVMLYKLYFAPCHKSTINGNFNFNRPISFLNSEFRCLCLNS